MNEISTLKVIMIQVIVAVVILLAAWYTDYKDRKKKK